MNKNYISDKKHEVACTKKQFEFIHFIKDNILSPCH